MRVWVLASLAGLASAGAAQAAEQPWTLHKALNAPSNLTLSGSARIRFETLGGQVRPGFGTGEDMLVVRTTLFAERRAGAVRIGGELFDSRAYGVDRGGVLSTADVNALEPVQAYIGVNLGPMLGKGTAVDVQLGRMALNLGSRRLVAADDYRNTTNGYTGVKLEAKGRAGTALTLVYLQPQARLPEDMAGLRANRVRLDDESGDLALWGGIASKAGLFGKAALELEYFGLDERDAPGRATRNRHLHTYGARLFRAPETERLDYDFEGFRQDGTIRASTAAGAGIQQVAAGFAHAELGYQWGGGWKPHLALEYDWASGDRAGGDYGHFDTLFGMRRADYAPSGIFAAIGRANSHVAGLRLEATPSPRWDVMAHYGPMWLDAAEDAFSTTGVRDAAGRSGRFAGHLVEGRLRCWIVPRALRFEANAVLLAKGHFLAAAPNAPRTGDTAYVSGSLTATF